MKLLHFLSITEADESVHAYTGKVAILLAKEFLQRGEETHANAMFNLELYGDPYIDDEQRRPDHDELYKEWVVSFAQERVEHAASILDAVDIDKQGNVMVYRELTADSDWIENIDARGLGEYWAWDKHAAEAHWGEPGSIKYLITASVAPDTIDWERSLLANAHPVGEDEKEVYIYSGSAVNVIQIEANGQVVDPQLYAHHEMLQASIGEAIQEKFEKPVIWDNGRFFIAVNNPAKPTFFTAWTQENEKIGTLSTKILYKKGEPWVAVDYVDVHGGYRRQGIARALYHVMLQGMSPEFGGLFGYGPDIASKHVGKIYKRMGAHEEDGHYYVPNPNHVVSEAGGHPDYEAEGPFHDHELPGEYDAPAYKYTRDAFKLNTGGAGGFSLLLRGENIVEINQISSEREGGGTAMMDMLTELADKMNIILVLRPEPYDTGGSRSMSLATLRNSYVKYDFESTGHHNQMARLPFGIKKISLFP